MIILDVKMVNERDLKAKITFQRRVVFRSSQQPEVMMLGREMLLNNS